MEHLDDLYRGVKSGLSLTGDWAALLDTLGRDVEVRMAGIGRAGRAESVDDRGNLFLTCPDGSTFKATAGEVTLQSAGPRHT